MTFSSVILERLIYIYNYVKDSYQKSYLNWIIERIFKNLSASFENSVLVQKTSSAIKSHRDDTDISLAWSTFKKTRNKISGLIKKTIDKSAIVAYLTDRHTDVYGLMLLIILAPFIPTSIMILLSIFIIAVAKIRIITEGTSFKYSKIYLVLYSLFIVSLLIGALFNLDMTLGIGTFIMYLSCIYLGLMIPYILNSRRKIKMLLNGLSVTLLLVSLHGIYQKIVGVPVDPAWIDARYGQDTVRIYSVFENPNVYGEYLILVIPAVFALFNSAKSFCLKGFYFGVMALGILNVFLTLSRASMIGLFLAIIIIILLIARKYIPFLAIALVLSPFLLPDYIVERVLSIFGRSLETAAESAGSDSANASTDTSIAYRGSIYGSSLSMVKDNFLTGVGLGQFREVYKNYSVAKSFHAHNTFLMIIIEGGILAIVSFISLGLIWSKKMISTLRYRKDLMSFAAVSSFAAIAGCSVQGLADHIWHNYNIMFMYFMTIGIGYASYYLAGGENVEN